MNYKILIILFVIFCSCNSKVIKEKQAKQSVVDANDFVKPTEGEQGSSVFKKNGTEKINQKDARGRKQGKWITYSLRHHIWNEYNYVNDTLNGFLRTYYDNGAVECESHFTMGIMDSSKLFREKGGIYNENGSLKVFIKMKNGKREWIGKYGSGGKLGWEEFYKNGRPIKDLLYCPNGSVSVGYPDTTKSYPVN